MDSRAKSRLTTLLKFVFAIGLIYWMVQRGHLDIKQLSLFTQPQYIALFLGLGLVNTLINHWRWVILLAHKEFREGFWAYLPLSFIGIFFNFAIPGSIGGDFVKAYYIVKENPQRRVDAASTVVMDRLIGLYSMFFLSVFAMAIEPELVFSTTQLRSMALFIILVFIGFSVFLALALSRRFKNLGFLQSTFAKIPGGAFIEKAYLGFQSYRSSPFILAKGFLLSLLGQLTAILLFIAVGFILGEKVSLAGYLFVVPLGFIVSSIPIVPGGVGVGQVAFLVLFRLYTGETLDAGPTGITLLQISLLAWGLFGAYFYLQRRQPLPKAIE